MKGKYLVLLALIGLLIGLLLKNKTTFIRENRGGGGGGGGRGGGGMAGFSGGGGGGGYGYNTYRGPGGPVLRGAVYADFGSPYGYPSDIMPDCYDKCCNQEDCRYGSGCRWNSGGYIYTGKVASCHKHVDCIKTGGTEDQCKKESGSYRLV